MSTCLRMQHLMLCVGRRTKPSMFVLKLYLESERKMPISSLQHCSLLHGFPASCSASPFAALQKTVITVCIPSISSAISLQQVMKATRVVSSVLEMPKFGFSRVQGLCKYLHPGTRIKTLVYLACWTVYLYASQNHCIAWHGKRTAANWRVRSEVSWQNGEEAGTIPACHWFCSS